MKVIGIVWLIMVFIGALYECCKEYGAGIAIVCIVIGLIIGFVVKALMVMV